jgi:uncharacterized protein
LPPPGPNRFSSFRQRLQSGQLLIRRNMQGRFKKNQQQISGRSVQQIGIGGRRGSRSLPGNNHFCSRREKMYAQLGAACFSSFHQYRHMVNKTVIEVHVRAVLPTSGGCAVFIGNSDKVFIVYVDQTVGSAITMFMREMSKERPLTHDLMAHLMTAVGAHVERVIINDLKNATYYARMIIAAENELQQKKIIELDARPSDCIAMATQQKAPIYVSQEVWDEVEDMSDVLRKMEEEGLKPEIDPESEATEEE